MEGRKEEKLKEGRMEKNGKKGNEWTEEGRNNGKKDGKEMKGIMERRMKDQ